MTSGATAHALFPDDDDRRRWEESEASFIRFIQANDRKIKQFLERVCDDPGLAEDAFQEAMMVAQAKWDVVSQHDQPLLWVRKTAWYKLLGMLHDRRTEVVGLEEIDVASIADPSDEWEAEFILQQLLRQLPTRQRAVLALAADGCSDEEISQQLGLAMTTVRTYKSAARRKLKDIADRAGYDAATRRRGHGPR